jgi:carbamate kinase
MFGIKTKKDKQIEELKTQLSAMYFKHPHIIETHGNVVSVGAIAALEEGMPAEYAKQMIARKLVDEAIRFIHYDLEQHDGRNVLKGYIQVVTYGGNE